MRILCTVSLPLTEVLPVVMFVRREVSVMMTLLKNHSILTVSIPQYGIVHWTLTEQLKVYVVVSPAIGTELGDFVKETSEFLMFKWKKHKLTCIFVDIITIYIKTKINIY